MFLSLDARRCAAANGEELCCRNGIADEKLRNDARHCCLLMCFVVVGSLVPQANLLHIDGNGSIVVLTSRLLENNVGSSLLLGVGGG